jgi:hypothetical protein
MIDQSIRDLWIPTGLILGFQMTLFKWRIEREVSLIERGPIYLVPSDYLSVVGMLCFVFGVFLLPIMGVLPSIAPTAFGLGVLLFVGQVLALAGHYDMYNRRTRRVAYFPKQERIAIVGTVAVAAVYLLIQFVRR